MAWGEQGGTMQEVLSGGCGSSGACAIHDAGTVAGVGEDGQTVGDGHSGYREVASELRMEGTRLGRGNEPSGGSAV